MKRMTQERLKELLEYNPKTGVFKWRVCGKGRRANRVAGWKSPVYTYIKFKNIKYPGHLLAFLYMTGSWPVNRIEHMNDKTNDNRWVNLREVRLPWERSPYND